MGARDFSGVELALEQAVRTMARPIVRNRRC